MDKQNNQVTLPDIVSISCLTLLRATATLGKRYNLPLYHILYQAVHPSPLQPHLQDRPQICDSSLGWNYHHGTLLRRYDGCRHRFNSEVPWPRRFEETVLQELQWPNHCVERHLQRRHRLLDPPAPFAVLAEASAASAEKNWSRSHVCCRSRVSDWRLIIKLPDRRELTRCLKAHVLRV